MDRVSWVLPGGFGEGPWELTRRWELTQPRRAAIPFINKKLDETRHGPGAPERLHLPTFTCKMPRSVPVRFLNSVGYASVSLSFFLCMQSLSSCVRTCVREDSPTRSFDQRSRWLFWNSSIVPVSSIFCTRFTIFLMLQYVLLRRLLCCDNVTAG